jgi:hypothetical protein
MKTTYGSIQLDGGPGLLRPFKITELMGIDKETGDGRLFESAGSGVRTLPRTVFGGFREGGAHDDNVVIGRLDAVEFDPENQTATGWGWLLDDDNGRQAALYAETQALRHNSVHLAEIEMEIRWKSDDPDSPDFLEYTLVFPQWKIASTTMLAIPAFAESTMELTASMIAAVEPSTEILEISNSPVFEATFDVKFPEPTREVTAALDPTPRPAWEYFYRAEGSHPQPITLAEAPDEDGFLPFWGNLARWNVCHDGIDARCVIAPYDPTEYSTFNCGQVLTTRGAVPTGPVFFKGGHPDKPLGDRDVAQAYGGVENAWGDARVTHGQHGPWICGVVRPGMTPEAIYAVRASPISGHWAADGRLKAIVSVNTPGYDVPRSKVFTDENGNVLEVVASFIPDCSTAAPAPDDPIVDIRDHTHGFRPGLHSHPITLNARPETFSMFTEEQLREMAVRIATLAPLETPAEPEVDPTDEDAVKRHLALLDLEAEDDFEAGLV